MSMTLVLALQPTAPAPGAGPTVSPSANPAPAATAAPASVAGMPAGAQSPTAAQGTGVVGQPGATPLPAQPPMSPMQSLMPLLIIGGLFILMIVMTSMAGRKERKKRAEMLASLSTGDRVQTVGGILGHIAEIRDDEVTIRVDEVSNTRIKFARSAIQSVTRRASEKAGSASEPKPAGAKVGV